MTNNQRLTTRDENRLAGQSQPIRSSLMTIYLYYWKPHWLHPNITPFPVCCLAVIFLSSPATSLSILHRQGQFQADLKVNMLSEPSQVSLSCIRHLSPSHALCHPHSLSVCLSCLTLFPHLFHYLGSSKVPASFRGWHSSFPSLFF